jgi:hypothetical protein
VRFDRYGAGIERRCRYAAGGEYGSGEVSGGMRFALQLGIVNDARDLRHAAQALLNHMRQFMADDAPSLGGRTIELAGSEMDLIAIGKGARTECHSYLRVQLYTEIIEVDSEGARN